MPASRSLLAAVFLTSFAAVLFELVLTRLFGVVLFASFAHLALAVALMGTAAGALAQHLAPRLVPDDGLEARAAQLAVAQGLASALAVALVLGLPLTVQSDAAVGSFIAERKGVQWDLVDVRWFALLLPALTLPFVPLGALIAGLFQRRRAHVGAYYAADLLGGAAGALAFVPLLSVVPAPQATFVVGAACASAAVAAGWGHRARLARGLVALGACYALLPLGLHVRYPAGFSEHEVVAERWTPVARLAVREGANDVQILVDNTSASSVVTTPARRARAAEALYRSLVFQLQPPPGRVAVLAASAGPDVAVAQHYGYTDIDAIDVTPEIGDWVAERWADAPANPYRAPGTRRVVADARAAVAHAAVPYDVIQLVHANLYGATGLLADAWSPTLLGTREAFGDYLAHVSPDGTISFARDLSTGRMVRAAAAALQERGVQRPWRHIAYVDGPFQVMLVKPRPFTDDERARLLEILEAYPRSRLVIDPGADPDDVARSVLFDGPPLTDDRPFTDTPRDLWAAWRDAPARWLGWGEDRVPLEVMIHYVFAAEVVWVLLAGVALAALPRRRLPLPALGYGACLGYGYLALEIVLVHELVLYVGHPVYAVATVVAAMLVGSGVGSALAERAPVGVVPLRAAIGLGIGLGALHATAIPWALGAFAMGLPLAARVAICGALIAPLGLVLGVPFPLALRGLRAEDEPVIPWMWAFNGWSSVAASVGTVLVSRLYGYTAAFAVALAAYALGLWLAGRLPRSG